MEGRLSSMRARRVDARCGSAERAVVALGSGRGLDKAVTFAEGLAKPKARSLLH